MNHLGILLNCLLVFIMSGALAWEHAFQASSQGSWATWGVGAGRAHSCFICKSTWAGAAGLSSLGCFLSLGLDFLKFSSFVCFLIYWKHCSKCFVLCLPSQIRPHVSRVVSLSLFKWLWLKSLGNVSNTGPNTLPLRKITNPVAVKPGKSVEQVSQ